jgi:multidrug efflux system membrane fusion protein
MTRAFVLVRALGILAIAATSGSGCGKAKDTPMIGKRQKLEYPVDVAPLEQRSMTFSVEAPGSVDAYQVQITARVGGPVDEVKFMEGDDVNKDQALVTIDRARYAIALEQAKSAYAKAVATEKSAEAALNRRLEAEKASPGVIAGEEIEQKQTAVDTAKADVDAAKEAQAVSELDLKESVVLATVKGTVQTRTVQQGQYLAAGNVLATIIQREPMLLRFSVSETDAPRLRRAMERGPLIATFVMPRDTPFQFQAKLSFLGEAADPSTRLFLATAEVIPPMKTAAPGDKDAMKAAKRLRPGAFAQVSIPVGAARPGMVVPQIAVTPTEKGKVVYIVDKDNIAHQKVVETGMHTSQGGIEITRGVNPGDLLVVAGADPLTEGATVTIKSKTTLEAALQAGQGSDATADAPLPPLPATGSGSNGSAALPIAAGSGK